MLRVHLDASCGAPLKSIFTEARRIIFSLPTSLVVPTSSFSNARIGHIYGVPS